MGTDTAPRTGSGSCPSWIALVSNRIAPPVDRPAPAIIPMTRPKDAPSDRRLDGPAHREFDVRPAQGPAAFGGDGRERMVDTQRLAHLDPVDLLDEECERLERFFETLEGADWSRETRCAGWGPREV